MTITRITGMPALTWEPDLADDEGPDWTRLHAAIEIPGLASWHLAALAVTELDGQQVAVGDIHQAELDAWGSASADDGQYETIEIAGAPHRYVVFASPFVD